LASGGGHSSAEALTGVSTSPSEVDDTADDHTLGLVKLAHIRPRDVNVVVIICACSEIYRMAKNGDRYDG